MCIILFYGIVTIKRPYGVFLVPFFYLLIFNSFIVIRNHKNNQKLLYRLSQLGLFTLGISMFLVSAFKFFYIFDSWEERNPKYISRFINKYIPYGSNVIGFEVYYYSVVNANSEFQFIHRYEDIELREKYHRKIYDYEYILISDELAKRRPILFKYYQKHANLLFIDRFERPMSPITKFFHSNRPYLVSFFNYNGNLYKRLNLLEK